MAISLPPAYPLQPAIVTGRSRVLVDEKKWRSWMLIVQGVIMFSNGNLVDGLLSFRRNVQGALKGQSECAICYSVISTDMQTPNKRCATCKNAFHSVCLFRWFKSSNQSTCPLCRNSFVYVWRAHLFDMTVLFFVPLFFYFFLERQSISCIFYKMYNRRLDRRDRQLRHDYCLCEAYKDVPGVLWGLIVKFPPLNQWTSTRPIIAPARTITIYSLPIRT